MHVRDPDTEDEGRRRYSWDKYVTQYFPNFFINSSTGDIIMDGDTKPGR